MSKSDPLGSCSSEGQGSVFGLGWALGLVSWCPPLSLCRHKGFVHLDVDKSQKNECLFTWGFDPGKMKADLFDTGQTSPELLSQKKVPWVTHTECERASLFEHGETRSLVYSPKAKIDSHRRVHSTGLLAEQAL